MKVSKPALNAQTKHLYMPQMMQNLIKTRSGPGGAKLIYRHAVAKGLLSPIAAPRWAYSSKAPARAWRPRAEAASVDTAEGAATSSGDDIPTEQDYIAHCQENYAIPGLVDVSGGPGGLPFVTLRHPNGAQAQLCLHGAAVTSWKRTDGGELLFLRGTNKFDGTEPVAGGVGVAWPQLGPGQLPLHGLLRLMHWSVVETEAWESTPDPKPSVSLYAHSGAVATEAEPWEHSFEAIYSVTLESPPPPENALTSTQMAALQERAIESLQTPPPPESIGWQEEMAKADAISTSTSLRCKLKVHNNGDTAFSFTTGLLTHFATEDIRENKKFVKVLGLGGKYVLDYSDDPMRPRLYIENDDFVFFNPDSGKNVDKLYVDCADEGHVLFCPGTQHHVEIRHLKGYSDLEVLHPAGSAPDVARRCVCLGSARKARPVTLEPGQVWEGEVLMSAHNRYWDLPPFEAEDPSTVPVPPREEALPPRRGPHATEEAMYS